MKQWMKRHRLWTLLLGFIFIYLILIGVGIAGDAIHAKAHQQAYNDAAVACTMNPQTFLDTVNQWRAAKGVAPLQYSTQLETYARARIADMQKYQYYGHTNPVTKKPGIQQITDEIGLPNNSGGEVLDGLNNATDSLGDFKNSPEHYGILTDSNYHYIGLVSLYLPENWDVYNNSGDMTLPGGTTKVPCIVIADLTDKVATK